MGSDHDGQLLFCANIEFLRTKVVFFHVGIVQKLKTVKNSHVYGNHYLHASQQGVVPGGDEEIASSVFVENCMENKIECKKKLKNYIM